MAVPEGKRGQCSLMVDTKAYELLKYTNLLSQNGKRFQCEDSKVSYTWLGEDMLHTASDILCYIRMANAASREDDNRDKMQISALSCTVKFDCLIQTAYEAKVLKSKQVKFLSQSVHEVRELIAKWRKSDEMIRQKK